MPGHETGLAARHKEQLDFRVVAQGTMGVGDKLKLNQQSAEQARNSRLVEAVDRYQGWDSLLGLRHRDRNRDKQTPFINNWNL